MIPFHPKQARVDSSSQHSKEIMELIAVEIFTNYYGTGVNRRSSSESIENEAVCHPTTQVGEEEDNIYTRSSTWWARWGMMWILYLKTGK
jgi:hypothetical protein